MDILQLLFSSLGFMEENLIWFISPASWEPTVEASGDLWPLSFGTGGFTAGSEASVQRRSNMRCLQHSPGIPSGILHPLSQHPTGRAGRSEAPQPAAKKTDLLSATWSLSAHGMEKHQHVKAHGRCSQLKACFSRIPAVVLSVAYSQNQNSL